MSSSANTARGNEYMIQHRDGRREYTYAYGADEVYNKYPGLAYDPDRILYLRVGGQTQKTAVV